MSTSEMSKVSQFLDPDSLERARSQIKKTKLDYYNGTLYFTQFTPDLEEQFRQISTADLKDDDILVNGFPRSGNHLVWEILHMILNDTTEFTDRTWTANVFDIWGNDVHKKMNAHAAPRVFGSHLRAQRLPKAVLEKPIKLIYPIRNPKDVLPSWFNITTKLQEGERWPGDWNEFFELQMTGDFVYGSWFDHVNAFERFMKQNPQVKVHVIQFEKLLENPVKEISALCRFLGKSDSVAADIAEATSFENMKKKTQGKSDKENLKFATKDGQVSMSSGKTSSWKSKFTVKQNEVFDAVFEHLMKGNNLAELVREY